VATPAFAGEDVDVLALMSDANRRRLLENARDERHPEGLRGDRIVETAPGMVRVLDPVGLAEMVRTFVI
jgi:hypothetical protein